MYARLQSPVRLSHEDICALPRVERPCALSHSSAVSVEGSKNGSTSTPLANPIGTSGSLSTSRQLRFSSVMQVRRSTLDEVEEVKVRYRRPPPKARTSAPITMHTRRRCNPATWRSTSANLACSLLCAILMSSPAAARGIQAQQVAGLDGRLQYTTSSHSTEHAPSTYAADTSAPVNGTFDALVRSPDEPDPVTETSQPLERDPCGQSRDADWAGGAGAMHVLPDADKAEHARALLDAAVAMPNTGDIDDAVSEYEIAYGMPDVDYDEVVQDCPAEFQHVALGTGRRLLMQCYACAPRSMHDLRTRCTCMQRSGGSGWWSCPRLGCHATLVMQVRSFHNLSQPRQKPTMGSQGHWPCMWGRHRRLLQISFQDSATHD